MNRIVAKYEYYIAEIVRDNEEYYKYMSSPHMEITQFGPRSGEVLYIELDIRDGYGISHARVTQEIFLDRYNAARRETIVELLTHAYAMDIDMLDAFYRPKWIASYLRAKLNNEKNRKEIH